MKPYYQSASLQNVMQFFADAFDDECLRKNLDGSVCAEWWIDLAKGEVIFKLVIEEGIDRAK